MITEQPELFAMPAPAAPKRRGRGDAMRASNEKEVLWHPDVMHLSEEQRTLLFGDIPRETRLTVAQVCRRLGCDSNTVYRLLQEGALVGMPLVSGSKRETYRVYRWSLVKYIYDQLEGDWDA